MEQAQITRLEKQLMHTFVPVRYIIGQCPMTFGNMLRVVNLRALEPHLVIDMVIHMTPF
jgi:hypothetical protein